MTIASSTILTMSPRFGSDVTENGGASEWFGTCDDTLEQGDILNEFAVLLPTGGSAQSGGLVRKVSSVAVLTQSCDVPKPSQETILLAQVFHWDVASETQQHLRASNYCEALARGNSVADFLLPPDHTGEPFRIVSFRNLFVLPKAYVLDQRAPQHCARLLSPYREYFSQAYARFMMRVGLPRPIDGFPPSIARRA